MQSPDTPKNEVSRLEALNECAILDTCPEERFDRLTRLAKHTFKVEIALVSLVDAERQWFKSSQGLDAHETPRDISFCGHAILDDEILYIPDTKEDQRFADNPLVTGAPYIRFYAGAPIKTDRGHRIGTLCIIDNKPRQLSKQNLSILRDLADCVQIEINQLNRQQQQYELARAHQLEEAISRAQLQFIRESDHSKSFNMLLADILDLSASTYGFIAEVILDDKKQSCLKTCAVANNRKDEIPQTLDSGDVSKKTQPFSLNMLLDAGLTNEEPIIANDAALDSLQKNLPLNHLHLKSFLAIPIQHNDKLMAVIGIVNRAGGYNQTLINFINPLITTLSQLINAAKLQREHNNNQIELARLSQVASQTTNGVIITDLDGRIEWVNEGFTKISGYTLNEIRGRTPGEVLQGEDSDPQTRARMHKSLSEGKPFEADIINYNKSGQWHWVHINCNPLKDSNNKLQGFIAIQSDITRQKEDSQRILDSEQRLAAVIDGTRIGTWEWNIKTDKIIFNKRWANIIGYSLEELPTLNIQKWFELLHPDDLIEIQNRLKQHIAGELECYEIQYRIRHKDGQWIWVHDHGKLVSWSNNGQPLLMSGTHADITQQKQAEQQLADAYELLERCNEAARIGTWEIDLVDMQPHWSRVTKEIHEVPEDFICPLEDAIKFYKEGESRDAITSLFQKSVEEGKPYDIELMLVTAKGNERWVRAICVPVFQNGKCHRLYGVFLDISDRKLNEIMIDEMNQRLSLAADSACFGVWDWNLVINDLTWDTWMFRLYGIDQNNFPGAYMAWHNSVHPEDMDRANEEIQLAIKGEKEFDTEFRIIHPDNGIRYIKASALVVRDNNGVALRMIGVNYDITNNKQVELALQENANYTQAIIDHMIDSIISIDSTGNIASINPATEIIFDYSTEEIIGKNISILLPNQHHGEHKEYLNRYKPNQDSAMGICREAQGKSKNGRLFPIELTVSEVTHQSKPMYVALLRDISERKRTEQMKSEFVSTVSHELRTPLTSIAGSLGLITGGAVGLLPERIQQMINIAYQNSQRLTYLINDLLDMDKLVAGKMEFNLQPHSLRSLITQALEENSTYGGKQQASVLINNDIPDVNINVDSQRFMQIMSNLLSNAIKYSDPNNKIEISVSRQDRSVKIIVTDFGTGIPESFRKHIFQKFAQADSSDTRKKGGTGLGLAITKELVERMGGNIGFESTEGKGSRFFFDIPICSPKQFQPKPDSLTKHTQILIIGNDNSLTKTLNTSLANAGFKTKTVFSELAALTEIQYVPHYTAVVLDLKSTDKNDVETISRIRQQSPKADIPILAILTGPAAKGSALPSNYHNIEWITKPFDEAQLLKQLKKLLSDIPLQKTTSITPTEPNNALDYQNQCNSKEAR